MDDLAGAAVHLGTLGGGGGGNGAGGMVRVRRALLWLHLGDVDAARACVVGEEDGGVEERVVRALCDMADGEYDAALAKWTELKELVDDEMVGVNMAVCLLYVGRMHEVSGMFCCSVSSIVDAIMMVADVKTGPCVAGTARGRRKSLAYAALQPLHHVRALHG